MTMHIYLIFVYDEGLGEGDTDPDILYWVPVFSVADKGLGGTNSN